VKVVSPDEAVTKRRGPILGAVGDRDLIRARLLKESLSEGRDFLFVA
jgi:hypothetical protein